MRVRKSAADESDAETFGLTGFGGAGVDLPESCLPDVCRCLYLYQKRKKRKK